MGLLPMPAEGQPLDSAYAIAARASDFVPVWGRPTRFYDLAEDLSGSWGSVFVKQLIRDNGMFPLVQMSFIDTGLTLVVPPGLAGATLADPAWREAWLDAALSVVRAARPRYLSLGNEVNRWYEKYGAESQDPNGFQRFVSLYEETRDSVKALSPATNVFCIFAREVVSENRAADMAVLDMFDPARLDLLVLTSYPHALASVNRPSDIPDGYYLEAAARMPGKPLGFSEVAWPSDSAFGGEAAQDSFITQLTGRLTAQQGVDLDLLGWPWLTDLTADDHTGLIRRDGTPKPAWLNWQQLFAGPSDH